ncbi:MAG: hypothetical protein Q9181_008354, partial [Wetmoreana brouardii]
ANLERKDYQGQTAMITAVKYGRPDAIELLIKANASLWPKDPSGKSLLQIASSLEEPMAPGKMFTKALGVWFEEYPRAEALFGSAAFKEFLFDSAHVEIIKTLIESYADVEERTAASESMLHLAVPSAPERVRVILETVRDRFDVDALDDDERTLLHYAPAMGKVDTIELLLEHGADIEIMDRYQASTLHFSVHSVACTTLTIERGDLIHARDNFCRTALHYAALVKGGNDEVKDLLVAAGVKTGAVDLQCKTAQCYNPYSLGSHGHEEVTRWIDHMYLSGLNELSHGWLYGALENG